MKTLYNQENYFKQLHLHLNKLYYNKLFGTEESDHYLDEGKLKKLESKWIASEIKDCLRLYSCDKTVTPLVVEESLKNHPVYHHPLFDYFLYDATLSDLKRFILNESILNLEFFDYLALSIIGTADQTKSEIASNLWDEAGHGNVKKFHTVLFQKLMHDLGLNYQRDAILKDMAWEAIAGINLFSHFALYPANKMKNFGLLAATEMLDPDHYHKFIQGIRRICQGHSIDYTYYLEHETIDVVHGKSWLEKVIIPELSKHPHKIREFWLGFYMRLNSVNQYYNHLFNAFTTLQAA